MKKIFFKSTLIFASVLFHVTTFAQNTSIAKPAKNLLDMDTVLLIVAMLLVIPIYVLAKAFLVVAKDKMEKERAAKSNIEKTSLMILLLLSTASSFAQDIAVKTKVKETGFFDFFTPSTWLFVITILLELIIILFLSVRTVQFIKPEKLIVAIDEKEKVVKQNKLKLWFNNQWSKMNNFRPIEEEANIDTGHSYDGIRELDNPAPVWFKAAFVLSILFAIIYLYRYHISKSAPLQIEEYSIAMKNAEVEHQAYLKTQADVVDENNVKMLDADGVATGKLIFKEKCAVCHTETGGGGTGPNLADNYWIHGGSIANVFKSIKYGWVEKGMKSWQDELSPKQISQVTSFVKSIKGTNPPNPKAPEGELFVEDGTVTTQAVAKDSLTKENKKDTLSNKK